MCSYNAWVGETGSGFMKIQANKRINEQWICHYHEGTQGDTEAYKNSK